MYPLLIIALLALPSVLAAQTAAQSQPPEVPVTAEHHHHLALGNTYVRAYKVEVPPHSATLMHRHDVDYLYVVLGDADIINAVKGKPEARIGFKDTDIHFSRGGFAHIAKNESDVPFRNVTIELLRPQGAEHSLCAGPDEAHPENCRMPLDKLTQPLPNGQTSVPQLETQEVRVSLIGLDFGAKMYSPNDGLDRLVVALEDAQVEDETAGNPPATLRSGDMVWLPAGIRHTLTNVGTRPARIMFLEFKDSGREKSSGKR